MMLLQKYSFLLLAITSYFAFFVTAIAVKTGRTNSPLGSFNKLHFRFSLFYLAASAGHLLFFNVSAVEEIPNAAIGLFFYFGIHYAIFLNFFALAQRSISGAILIMIKERGGKISAKACMADYADGKGFAHIKTSRLQDMQVLGFIREKSDKYEITPKGIYTARIIQLIFSVWGLNQLGKDK